MIVQTQELVSGYDDMDILRGVTVAIPERKTTTLIGPNGAGKSTFLKTLFGLVRPRRGRVMFQGQDVTGWPTRKLLALGMAMVPQGRCNFPSMTVRENLEMGAYIRRDRNVQKDIAHMFEQFPVLGHKRNDLAGYLSGGQQQILEMAMALLLHPKVLLVDEPSIGLAPNLVESTFQEIRNISRQGVTVIMVEQNATKALSFSDYCVVLDLGVNRLEGPAGQILENPDVKKMYLGG